MRMRRKRNLEPRMEACAALLIARGRPCLNLKKAAEEYRALVNYAKLFGNKNPVELEVGCGNGGFIAEKAKRFPDINFLAVELCTNVVLTAMERIRAEGIPNVRFLNIPAEILPCYLPEGSVERIYLNFSTPLPETSREKQRLTAPRFLQIYRTLLKEGGSIEQKTDSEPFFDYSLEQYAGNGFSVGEITRDLHHSEYVAENIVTEYEQNFVAQGKKIFRAVAVKN
ncbi:MAG: tRNA (guanosine(46)-N7)-methyltransferase TrmB [Clostridia bacterium]|nr:tRNA (guanosine(46)-N7)-methyltransferase TrmB [Clostridia bacterium]